MRCSRWRRASSGAPTGAASLSPPSVACCLTRVDVGGGSLRQYQAAGALERLSDGDRGRLRLRFLAAARPPAARAGGSTSRASQARPRVIAYPGILPDFIDLNTALRPFNGMLLIGLALGGGAAGAGSLHARRRLPGKIQLRHVHPARADSVVVPAPVAGVSAAASTWRS